jgi:heavy metal sensor kinase
MLWTSFVLGVSLAAGFAWVHYGLGRVLEARNDAFLARKAAELLAVVADRRSGGTSELEAEIRREVSAYEAEGLAVVVRERGRVSVSPPTAERLRLVELNGLAGAPFTIWPGSSGPRYRVLVSRGPDGGVTLLLALSLAETEATLSQFDRRVAGGAILFLILAVAGGFFLSRQALRPVAESVRRARRFDPEKLEGRLPRTGAGDEIDELAATINGFLDRLAAYHAQVIRFTSDASHELRSPLAAMRAAVDVALQQPRSVAEYRDALASLGEQCERLTTLVNSLLLLARADAAEVPLRKDDLELGSLAGEVVEMFEPLAEERGIHLALDCSSPVPARGDHARLRQLVTNLLDNALRFTGPGGSVTVTVRQDGKSAILCVTDSGQGIPPEHLPHIFDRFYQADAARASGGSGLGLSICRWIVEAHAGSIEAESEPGKGARFSVKLPLAHAEPGESRAIPGVMLVRTGG